MRPLQPVELAAQLVEVRMGEADVVDAAQLLLRLLQKSLFQQRKNALAIRTDNAQGTSTGGETRVCTLTAGKSFFASRAKPTWVERMQSAGTSCDVFFSFFRAASRNATASSGLSRGTREQHIWSQGHKMIIPQPLGLTGMNAGGQEDGSFGQFVWSHPKTNNPCQCKYT